MVDLATVTPPIALGPLDGRYRAVVAPLTDHLSEAALNRARLHVEIEWLIHLTAERVLPGAPVLSETETAYLRGLVEAFGPDEIAELAAIEAETRHDVKAVEYLLKRRLAAAAETPGSRGPTAGPPSCRAWARSSTSSAPPRTSTTSPTPSPSARLSRRCGSRRPAGS
ncbi:hypothetical protein ADENT20671_1935 [Actinomyces denticolens]|nr:hypothetical protein ADENT20671_1935 [Actinomyces denticolens]